MNNKRVRAELTLLLVAVLWGGGFVAVKDALDAVTPFYMIGIRFTIAAFILVMIFRHRVWRFPAAGIKAGLIIGFFLFAAFALQTIGLQYTLPGKQMHAGHAARKGVGKRRVPGIEGVENAKLRQHGLHHVVGILHVLGEPLVVGTHVDVGIDQPRGDETPPEIGDIGPRRNGDILPDLGDAASLQDDDALLQTLSRARPDLGPHEILLVRGTQKLAPLVRIARFSRNGLRPSAPGHPRPCAKSILAGYYSVSLRASVKGPGARGMRYNGLDSTILPSSPAASEDGRPCFPS